MGFTMEILVVTFMLYVCVAGIPPPEKCVKNWEKVGCYHDSFTTNADRVFPSELVNHRDPLNNNWDGHTLDWRAWPQSLHALACSCAEKTRQKGWKYFGLQFYGECWSGPTLSYGRDGSSDECVGDNYKACNDKSGTECVGKAFTNYVYKLKDQFVFHNPINGGWSEWAAWSTCSASCNGGRRTRARTCTNPKPIFGGLVCPGDANEKENCNTEACEHECDSKMDIGIILDASTSVTRRNWEGTLKFVKKLSKVFKIGSNGVHFGVIKFSWIAQMEFSLSDPRYWNKNSFEQKVSTIRYIYGGTRTDLAIEMAEHKMMCATCGTRKSAHKAILVVTDGVPSRAAAPLDEVTRQLKKDGVIMVSVGVGTGINYKELVKIATDPEHVIALNSYQYLDDPINKLVKLLCQRDRVIQPRSNPLIAPPM